ncbi:hypothetical protein [Bradyrhizobium yuanmingense]|uniref:hypothetical protein n=1 Tax=Bradyrhizobium yuanmingense TaxID=108015 RepID=UPI0023B905C0|nr:hypothetical protein [Bradyrhizobium yuanmingense]MDF0495142.1 hypothetical protein [Bradyrhizobium yuanmingense]
MKSDHMNDMIDRVAAAIAESNGDPNWEGCLKMPHLASRYRAMAKAAIEAIKAATQDDKA